MSDLEILGVHDGQAPSFAPLEELARLVFLSYRFSQGGVGTQNRMLLYVEKEFHPHLFSEPGVERIRRLAQEMIGPFFLNQTTHPATAIPWEDDSPEASIKTPLIVENELTGLFDRFQDRKQINGFTDSLDGIAESVITMDHDYLTRPNGRAGDSKALKIKVSPYHRDPYDSMFIKHALLGEPTRSVEFDDIFSRIGDDEILQGLDENTCFLLLQVINIYLENHPERPTQDRIMRTKNIIQETLNGER